MYPDGAGLYLQVTARGARSWVYRFMLNGAPRYMGLGPLDAVPLADARVKALEARRLRLAGIDPIKARNDVRAEVRLEAARSITFRDAAEAYMTAHGAGWRSAKHTDQWHTTLETFVYPVFGALPVQSVDVALVLQVLEPIWATKTETASRVCGYPMPPKSLLKRPPGRELICVRFTPVSGTSGGILRLDLTSQHLLI